MKETKTKDEVKIHPVLIWVGVPLLILGTIGFFIWKKKQKNEQNEEEKQYAQSNGSQITSKPDNQEVFGCKSDSYPLEFGTCHQDVTILQRYLKSMKANLGNSGKKHDGVDGKFGNLTRIAAKSKTGQTTFLPKDIEGMKQSLKIIRA